MLFFFVELFNQGMLDRRKKKSQGAWELALALSSVCEGDFCPVLNAMQLNFFKKVV